ncbi:MAG: DUF2059 domain-containing protein [Pseudomonadota bacterium]
MRALRIWPLMALLALPAWADARLTVAVDVLQLREAAAILRDEGLAHAEDLNQEMLGGSGGTGWQVQVTAIYDPERMVELVRAALGDVLEPDELEAVIAFYASDLGTKIVSLENSARVAMGAQDVEDAARARLAELEGTDNARLAMVRALEASGDMINRNVTSAMNSNFQFLRGMADGDGVQMSEEEMLSQVAGDIDEITEDTRGWLLSYFLLAYHPLSDAELQTYIDFLNTPAGDALNRAYFEGFGQAFEDISYGLGRAIALNMVAEEL